MAENTPLDPEQVKAAEENERFKKRLKEEYGIEDDADSFKEKRNRWARAEEEIPQYQATLNALVAHYRAQEEQVQQQPAVREADEDAEERKLRDLSKLDPYEGVKRFWAKKEKEFESKIESVKEEGARVAQNTTLARETMRRSRDIVAEYWPEAFDEKSELFKMGHRIYNQEMSPAEKSDPRSFLIATERAAGRIGLAPKNKRGNSARRSADAGAQSVSRGAAQRPSEDDNDGPLTARQKKIIEGLGVDEKTYRQAKKNRAEQGKKKQDDE